MKINRRNDCSNQKLLIIKIRAKLDYPNRISHFLK